MDLVNLFSHTGSAVSPADADCRLLNHQIPFLVGLGDTEKRAPRYIMKVFITRIDIITILHVNHKIMLYWFY